MMTTRFKVTLSLLAALAAGCTTMGTGFGSTVSGASPVKFTWTSSDPVSGTMDATSSGGKTYHGRFFQITEETKVDSVWPLWYAGDTGWGGWDGWDAAPSPGFITRYSGRVLANLGAPGGEHMRCSFQLVHPADGMAGGGRGECRMPDGRTIDATFPAA